MEVEEVSVRGTCRAREGGEREDRTGQNEGEKRCFGFSFFFTKYMLYTGEGGDGRVDHGEVTQSRIRICTWHPSDPTFLGSPPFNTYYTLTAAKQNKATTGM